MRIVFPAGVVLHLLLCFVKLLSCVGGAEGEMSAPAAGVAATA